MSEFTVNEMASMSDRLAVLENFISGLDKDELAGAAENSGHSDLLFLLICAFDIFLMQAGFALLEVGTVQAKNAKSILFKNTLDMAISMILWWCVGFGLAGGGASGQTGRDFFHIKDENTVSFIHSYVFAGTTATIVSGGVAERMNFTAYLLFSVVMVGLVYPLLAFWGWSSDGFLAQLGYKDFAGSGLIHLCGGLAALIGAKLVGPRFGRLKEENGTIQVIDLKGHSPVLSNFGTFVLLFGWLSFNGSSVLAGGTEDLILASRAISNTLLSIAGAALTSYFDDCRPRPDGRPSTHDLAALNNAMLAGAVGITAGCAFVQGWAALIIGIVSYFVFKHFSQLVIAYKIDDPLEASSVHGACGLWGVLAVGLFAYPGLTDGSRSGTGLFLGGNGRLLGAQLLGGAVVVAWTGAVALLTFKALDKLPGCQLRVDKDAELLGLDFAHHDGFAYPDLNKDAVTHFNEVKAAERRARARTAGLKPQAKEVKVAKMGTFASLRKRNGRKGEDNSCTQYSFSQSAYSGHSARAPKTARSKLVVVMPSPNAAGGEAGAAPSHTAVGEEGAPAAAAAATPVAGARSMKMESFEGKAAREELKDGVDQV
uniref:Ammonium transporter n=1 Tax=Heterosigma akashiwo TaxID=2829 RepID=A0A7S4DAR9_HETAK